MQSSKLVAYKKASLASFKSCLLLCILLGAIQHPQAVRATDDVVTPCELEAIIKQLLNPSSENKMHAYALRNELKNILRERQLNVGEEQYLNDYDYPEEDKRSVAALAAQGLLHGNSAKRSLATLAKNGQLPTAVPEESTTDNEGRNEDKRYVGALARSGGYIGYGKRNVGTLARDFQLPQNGKRNMATMARLGLLNAGNREPKRNVAAVARYNSKGKDSNGNEVDKRNLGALKGSPVHGAQQKREEEEYMEAPSYAPLSSSTGSDWDYADNSMSSYWWYPNYVGYADLDWDDYRRRAQKRFLATSKDPEIFGIENAVVQQQHVDDWGELMPPATNNLATIEQPFLDKQKRHLGAVYRSGFLPSYRALRSSTGSTDYGRYGGGGGSGRFSRSGRARQFVEYFPQLERLRQPIAAVCKRCFLPTTTYRPIHNWGFNAPTRGLLPKYIAEEEYTKSIATNSLPTSRNYKTHESQHPLIAAISHERQHSWGTPPRIAALHRRGYRRQDSNENSTS